MIDKSKDDISESSSASRAFHLNDSGSKTRKPWLNSLSFDDKKIFPFDDTKSKNMKAASSKSIDPKMFEEINRCKSTKSDYLDFSNMDITEIPKETFKDASYIQSLFLYGNKLSTLPDTIANLVNLERLFLQDNCFTFEKSFTMLDSLSNLQVIDLRRNNIKGDMPKFLIRQKQLRQLLLCSNKINRILPEIRNLSMLKIFTMSRNSLETSVPSSIFPLTELTLLDFSHTGISELPDTLCQCIALEHLHMKNNNLQTLPENIGQLTELKSLRLGNNKLRSLPKSLSNCSKLEILDVENNKLSQLPENIFINMKSLANVLLSYNEFHDLVLSDETHFESVRNIAINNNQLQEIPKSFYLAKNLVSINISENELSTISSEISLWDQIRELDLCGNQLTSLPVAIGQLKGLEILRLKYNQLETLPEAVGNLDLLTILDVESNSLQTLPETIGNLKNLIELNASINKLASLPESIGNLTNLAILKLAENRLQSIPPEIGNLSNLRELVLSDNPDLVNLPAELSLCSVLIVLSLERCSLSELPVPIVSGGSAMIVYFLQQVFLLRKQQNAELS